MVALRQLVGDSEEIIPALLAGASNAPVEASEEGQQEEDSRTKKSECRPAPGCLPRSGSLRAWLILASANRCDKASEFQWMPNSGSIYRIEVTEKDSHGQLLKYFSLQAVAEIDELLVQQVGPGQVDENIYDAVQTAMATGSGNTMNNVASEVFSHLQSGGSDPRRPACLYAEDTPFLNSGWPCYRRSVCGICIKWLLPSSLASGIFR